MKKILFILMVLVTSAAFGQGVRLKTNIAGFGGAHFAGVPPGYTKLNVRYEFVAMAIDSGLHVPQYNGTPSGVRTGVWVASGAIGMDTLNHRFYINSGGAWVRLANYAEIPASYTAGDGLLLTGSDFKVLTKRSIMIDNDSVMLVNDSTASPASYFYGTNSAGRKGWYSQSGITAGSVPISGLTAATVANDINNAAYQQTWRWNTLNAGPGLYLTSSSTVQSAGNGVVFQVSALGAHSNSSQTTFSGYFNTGKTGTSSTNIGVAAYAQDGTTNIGLQAKATGGTTNIALDLGQAGTSAGTMRINGATSGSITIQPAAAAGTYTLTLPTNDGDASQFLQTNGSGVLSWAASGGTPGGSDKQIQYNNAGAFGGSANMTQETGQILITSTGATNPFAVKGHEDNGQGAITEWQHFNAGAVLASINQDTTMSLRDYSGTVTTPAANFGKVYSRDDSLRFKNSSGTEFTLGAGGGSGANTALSNLASVAINTTLLPGSNDGAGLGNASFQFSDLFLAEGGVINWDNGDATLTQIGNTVTLAGAVFSSPGAGANSETFGANSSAAAINGTAFGYNASAGGTNSVAFGKDASASGVTSIAIGTGSTANQNSAMALGVSASATGINSTAIGVNSAASATYSTAIGQASSSSHQGSVAIGQSSATTASAQLIIGSEPAPISNVYFSEGVTNASPINWTLNGTGGSGTNIAGGSITIAGGKGTGNAAAGNIIFQTSTAGASSTTLQTLATRLTISPNSAAMASRFAAAQGADVASAAGAIALGTDGNTFEITGTAAITLISNVNWQNGSVIRLMFTSTATLTDGTANSGTDIGMELAGNTNFTGSAGAVVTMVLGEIGGTQRWYEVSRSVN